MLIVNITLKINGDNKFHSGYCSLYGKSIETIFDTVHFHRGGKHKDYPETTYIAGVGYRILVDEGASVS